MRALPLIVALLLLPLAARSQGTVSNLGAEFGGRFSAAADWKLAPGLHAVFEGELRSRDNFAGLGRAQFGAGLEYKFSKALKASAGYVFMENTNNGSVWKPRHRAYADLTGTLKSGQWRFSLKERLQMTCKPGANPYQTTPYALALKSRLKASYKGFGAVSPYAAAELRVALNDPACSATWNGGAYSGYTFKGYTDTYADRLRGTLGAEWKLDRSNELDFYLLGDFNYNKAIDTDRAGTTLKSLTWEKSFLLSIGVGYKFSF